MTVSAEIPAKQIMSAEDLHWIKPVLGGLQTPNMSRAFQVGCAVLCQALMNDAGQINV